MAEAAAIITASGTHTNARWIVEHFLWVAHKKNLFGEPAKNDYHEEQIEALIAKGIAEIDRKIVDENYTLPGKDKNQAQLETAIVTIGDLSAANRNLSDTTNTQARSVENLSNANETLSNANASLTHELGAQKQENREKDQEIKHLRNELEANKQQPKSIKTRQPVMVPESPAATAAPKSAKKKNPKSSKKQQATAASSGAEKDHGFERGDEVTVKRSYANKPQYTGQHGTVEEWTKTQVTVQFDDATLPMATFSHTSLE